MELELAGHALLFFDGREVGQGGPLAYSLSLDRYPMERPRFDPSPLEYQGAILIPLRRITFLRSGYALARIEPEQRKLAVLSRVRSYMKLIRIEDGSVIFETTAYGPEIDRIRL